MVGLNNPGGRRAGDRYVAPHLSRFVVPLSALRGPVKNRIVIAKQPPYLTRRLIRAWIGPYARLRGPILNRFAVPLKQPAYVTHRLVQPWIGPYPALRGPVHNTFSFPLKQPAYVTHKLVQPWIGPYPKLRGPLHETIVVAKQPTLIRPKPHQGKPVVAPIVTAPIGRALIVIAKQPAYVTHRTVKPWIGPYAPLRGPLHETLVVAKQPTLISPRPHQGKPIVGAPTGGPVGRATIVVAKQPPYITHRTVRPWIGPYPALRGPLRETIVTAKQPTVARPAPHIGKPFVAAAPTPPVSRNLLKRAVQPAYVTHRTVRPWLGPYAPLRGPVKNRIVLVRIEPPTPKPHIRPVRGVPVQPPIGKQYLVRGRQPKVDRFRPHLIPFTGYPAGPPPPPPSTMPAFGACTAAIASLAGACSPAASAIAGIGSTSAAPIAGVQAPTTATSASTAAKPGPDPFGVCP